MAVLISIVGVAAQQDPKAAKGRVVMPAPGATTASAFAVIENPGAYAVYLVSATTDSARSVTFVDGAKNNSVVKEVEIDGYEALTMAPTAMHMRLEELKQPLRLGDTLTITLTTELGVKIVVSATVVEKE